jgi:hypothetical protein
METWAGSAEGAREPGGTASTCPERVRGPEVSFGLITLLAVSAPPGVSEVSGVVVGRSVTRSVTCPTVLSGVTGVGFLGLGRCGGKASR